MNCYKVYDEELKEVEKVELLSTLDRDWPSKFVSFVSVDQEGELPPLLRLYVAGRGYSGGHNTAIKLDWPTSYPVMGDDFPEYRLVAWKDATKSGAFTGYYPGVWAYYGPEPEDLVVIQARTGRLEVFGLVQPDGGYESPSGFFSQPVLVPFSKAIAFAEWTRGWVDYYDPPQSLFDSFLRGDPPWRNAN